MTFFKTKTLFFTLLFCSIMINAAHSSYNLGGWNCTLIYSPGTAPCICNNLNLVYPWPGSPPIDLPCGQNYDAEGENTCAAHFPKGQEGKQPQHSICISDNSGVLPDACSGYYQSDPDYICCCYLEDIKDILCIDDDHGTINILPKTAEPCMDVTCNLNTHLYEYQVFPNCCYAKPDLMYPTNGSEDCQDSFACKELRECDTNANQCIYEIKIDKKGCCTEDEDCKQFACKEFLECDESSNECQYDSLNEDCCETKDDCPVFYCKNLEECDSNNKCQYTHKPYCCEKDENCNTVTGYTVTCSSNSTAPYKTCQYEPIAFCLDMQNASDCPQDPCSEIQCSPYHECQYFEIQGCRASTINLKTSRKHNKCSCTDIIEWEPPPKLINKIYEYKIAYYNGETIIELPRTSITDPLQIKNDFKICDNTEHLYIMSALDSNGKTVAYFEIATVN